jgi:SagB-type dehydrogenase family enzyme
MNEQIKKFYELTKFKFSKVFGKSIVLLEDWPDEWKKVFYKVYPRFPALRLGTRLRKEGELESLLMRRRSTREFSTAPLDIGELSSLIFYSVGISTPKKGGLSQAKRTYPSAGARYPIEMYLVVNNVENLDRGLYHYDVRDNVLEKLLVGNFSKKMVYATDSKMGAAPLVVILTGVLGRTEIKYGVNAYRFALLEAGHIGQNISLISEKNSLGSCAIGGFDNEQISRLLDLTEEEIPLYIFAVGKKNES